MRQKCFALIYKLAHLSTPVCSQIFCFVAPENAALDVPPSLEGILRELKEC